MITITDLAVGFLILIVAALVVITIKTAKQLKIITESFLKFTKSTINTIHSHNASIQNLIDCQTEINRILAIIGKKEYEDFEVTDTEEVNL